MDKGHATKPVERPFGLTGAAITTLRTLARRRAHGVPTVVLDGTGRAALSVGLLHGRLTTSVLSVSSGGRLATAVP